MKFYFKVFIFITILCNSFVANAEVYEDKLNTCLMESITASEKEELVKWIYFSMSAYPDLSKYSKVTDNEVEDSSKNVGKIFQNIFIKQCNQQIKDIVKFEGTNALENSFKPVG